jgi:hypothetical protein
MNNEICKRKIWTRIKVYYVLNPTFYIHVAGWNLEESTYSQKCFSNSEIYKLNYHLVWLIFQTFLVLQLGKL